MTPKFAVGEVVILQSKDHPECNGECEVLEVFYPGSAIGVAEGLHYKPDSKAFSYKLNKFYKIEHGGNAYRGNCFSERALRKKHQPGELSFDKLMSSLSQPVQEPSHS